MNLIHDPEIERTIAAELAEMERDERERALEQERARTDRLFARMERERMEDFVAVI